MDVIAMVGCEAVRKLVAFYRYIYLNQPQLTRLARSKTREGPLAEVAYDASADV